MDAPALILASRSPQRRAILQQIGLSFAVRVPDAPELTEGPPQEVVLENAFRKATAAVAAERAAGRDLERDPTTTVLGVDTIVALGPHIYGKPADIDAARATLAALNGREHVVLSGVCVIRDGTTRTAAARTAVQFRRLPEAALEAYVRTGEWRERAGGYAIQERGAVLVERIDGDYLNVVGLPVATLLDLAPWLLDPLGGMLSPHMLSPHLRIWDAVLCFVVAGAIAAALTPLAARMARRVGAVDEPRERGLAERVTPLLGGLAILAAVVIGALIFLPHTITLPRSARAGSGRTAVDTWGLLAGAGLITLVGVIDDIRALPPWLKLLGQIAAAVIAVRAGAVVTDVTIPFVQPLQFPHEGGELTVVWLVALMNVVNFTDGVDGLAAGLCAIDGVAFAIISLSLHVPGAALLAALTAGASLGFLVHNFYPAKVFMGDAGANLLGYLLGVAAVIGSLKTNAVVALVVPLCILAIPLADTSFVVAKRLKYGRKPWSADANHFHHRMARIGFSQRKTVAYLYAWSATLAGLAVAMRLLPYHPDNSHYNWLWVGVLIAFGVFALAASVYLVMVLEILKFRRLRSVELHEADPGAGDGEITARVTRDVETGEFKRIRSPS